MTIVDKLGPHNTAHNKEDQILHPEWKIFNYVLALPWRNLTTISYFA